jgi:hypothetical protein
MTRSLADLASAKAIEELLWDNTATSFFFSPDETMQRLVFQRLIKDHRRIIRGLTEAEEGQTTANSELTA